jgi:hypothetical protein
MTRVRDDGKHVDHPYHGQLLVTTSRAPHLKSTLFPNLFPPCWLSSLAERYCTVQTVRYIILYHKLHQITSCIKSQTIIELVTLDASCDDSE